jgi:hypothetical protein
MLHLDWNNLKIGYEIMKHLGNNSCFGWGISAEFSLE